TGVAFRISLPSPTAATLIFSGRFVRRDDGQVRGWASHFASRISDDSLRSYLDGQKGNWIREAADPCRAGDARSPRGNGARPAWDQPHGLREGVQRAHAVAVRD